MVETSHKPKSWRRTHKDGRGNKIDKGGHSGNKGTKNVNDWLTRLYDDKELDVVRWQFSLFIGPYPYCGAYRSNGRGFCTRPRNWRTDGKTGRCFWHGGASTQISKEGRRNVMMAKIMNGSRSKKDISLLNPTEMKLFDDLQEMIKREYEVYDPIAISQIARLLIFQSFLMDKLEQGFNVSIESSSQEIRKWLAEYGLTPKSKATTLNIDPSGYQPWSWAKMVEEYYEKYEKNKEKEVEENGE
ncbi:MAG TPA: hypothetical protein P5140_03760 [Methanofastidiosum sp.]|nr:hypothetical protein [Methanofastidiosum sp.]